MTPLPVAAVVVDFDGTVCPKDVSEELLGAFAEPGWWEVDLAFQRGEVGSRECLVRQARMVRATQEEMLAFALERFPLDPTFRPFAEWARGRGLELVVASDGMGFYVEPMLRRAGLAWVPVLTNEVRFEPEGPRFAFPHAHEACVGCGTCKMRAVLDRRERLGPVAFVGEGHSDRYGALYADLVFAKDQLAELCWAEGVPYRPWETFEDVRRGLEAVGEPPRRTRPSRCPGWTEPGPASPASTLPSQLR